MWWWWWSPGVPKTGSPPRKEPDLGVALRERRSTCVGNFAGEGHRRCLEFTLIHSCLPPSDGFVHVEKCELGRSPDFGVTGY